MLAIDPFQQQKEERGQFEFVLPRGTTFVHTKTIRLGKRDIYECQVAFDPNYESVLAPGRLRSRKVTTMGVPTETDANEIVERLSKVIVLQMDIVHKEFYQPQEIFAWIEPVLLDS